MIMAALPGRFSRTSAASRRPASLEDFTRAKRMRSHFVRQNCGVGCAYTNRPVIGPAATICLFRLMLLPNEPCDKESIMVKWILSAIAAFVVVLIAMWIFHGHPL